MKEIRDDGARAAERPSDEDLAAAFRETGDRAAFDTLIRRYSPRLRRMIVTLSRMDAETVLDAEQEVFVTVVRVMHRFRGDSRFSTFFFRVARNRILDLIRGAARYRRRVIPLPQPDLSPGGSRSPEELFLDGESTRTVRRAMSCLSAQDRLLLYLKDADGERIEDLAALSGLPAGTVKSRLARSRAKVAAALKEMGYEK